MIHDVTMILLRDDVDVAILLLYFFRRFFPHSMWDVLGCCGILSHFMESCGFLLI